MAIRFKNVFQTEGGQYFTLHIHDTDHTGNVVEVNTAPPGFILTYAGGENVFHPVIPSSCTVPLYIENATDEAFLNDLTTSDEGRFRITIRKGNSDTAPLWWVGVMTLDNITIPDDSFPYQVEIKAVDGLQLLSRIPYDNQAGPYDIKSVLLYVLNEIGTADLFVTDGADDVAMIALTDIQPDESTFFDPLGAVKLKPALWDPVAQVYQFDADCETVLTQIMRTYNMRCYMSAGKFWIDSIGKPLNSVATYAHSQFLWDGSVSTTTVPRLGVLNVNSASGGLKRLTGWNSQFLTPVKAVERPLNYGEGTIISNELVGGAAIVTSGATTGTSVVSYTFASENDFPVGSTFSMRGRVVIDADYLEITSNRTGRIKVSIMLKVGAYYLKRSIALHPTESQTVAADEFNSTPTADESVLVWEDPDGFEWNTTASNRVQFGSDILNYNRPVPNFSTGQDDRTTVQIDFTTPPLPAQASGNIELSFIGVGFNGNGGDMSQAKKDVTFMDIVAALNSGEGFNGNSVIYSAEIDNNATETRIEDPVIYGSQLVFTNDYYFNPAELYNVNGSLPDWKSTLTPTAAGVHSICVQDQLQYFSKPRRIWSGTVYGPLNQGMMEFHQWFFDYTHLKGFMLVSMTMRAEPNLYEVELHEIGKDGAPTSSVRKPGPGKVTPVLESYDALTKRTERGIRSAAGGIADLNTEVANITRTTDATGGLSSVELSHLGDVKISSPQNGHVLEYVTAAGRWANTAPSGGGSDNSLSETNQTIDEGVTRDIVLDGAVSNNTYFRIVDGSGNIIFSIQNYGTILNIIEYYGLIAYRSTPTAPGSIAVYEPYASGVNFVQIKSPTLSSDVILTLPDSTGSDGDVLTSNGSGVMTWEAPASGGSGYTGPIPLANISGRYMWSSADDGERVMTGSTAYGPFNFYSHTNEPTNTTIRTYSAAHVIGTTSGTMPAYYIAAFGVRIPTTDKKVRVDYAWRLQNAPNGSTWGMSLWGVATPASDTNSYQNFVLRGVSSDEAGTTSSTTLVTGSFTTTAAINGGYIAPMLENRSGSLTTTTYIYAQFAMYLID